MSNNKFSLANLFWVRKSGRGNPYDYDLFPLIKDFSFLNFMYEARAYRYDDYGAFLVISNKQYIIGYNAGFGIGSHNSAFAKVYKEMHGGGTIYNPKDADVLNSLCNKNFITARIFTEKISGGYTGCIHFSIPKDGISLEQFKLFEQFYDDYNEEISLTVSKYGITNFYVSYRTLRKNCDNIYSSDDLIQHSDKNLDNLKEFLRSRINPTLDYDLTNDEVIIGKGLKYDTKIRKR